MTLPQILVDLMKLLFDLAVPAAICTMVLAGIALRREGGVNFQAGGGFQRWALWSVTLLTVLVRGTRHQHAGPGRKHLKLLGVRRRG